MTFINRLTGAGVLMFLLGCAPTRPFYHPNNVLYLDPAKLNLTYEMMQFESKNGNNLFALLFRTEKEPKGIVVHFHGNYGNVSNHFLGSVFLLDYGFDVLIFDYQGFGGSEGTPTPRRTIEDGVAAVEFAGSLNRIKDGGVVILGQSLGGAVAIPVMAQRSDVKAAVIESAFTTYRGIARNVTSRSFLTWILYPIYPFFLPTAYDPVRHLDQIPPRPLLFIHGTKDRIVPAQMSKALYKKAGEPKSLWLIEGAGHIEGRRKEGGVYETRVAEFFYEAIQENKRPTD